MATRRSWRVVQRCQSRTLFCGAAAAKFRSTRLSWTAGPGFLPVRPRLVPKQLHHWLGVQIRHTVRSLAAWPTARSSSARSRWPKSGSPRPTLRPYAPGPPFRPPDSPATDGSSSHWRPQTLVISRSGSEESAFEPPPQLAGGVAAVRRPSSAPCCPPTPFAFALGFTPLPAGFFVALNRHDHRVSRADRDRQMDLLRASRQGRDRTDTVPPASPSTPMCRLFQPVLLRVDNFSRVHCWSRSAQLVEPWTSARSRLSRCVETPVGQASARSLWSATRVWSSAR